jgi:plastocyanin
LISLKLPLVAVALVLVAGVTACGGTESREILIDIPAGTAQEISNGEDPGVVPARIRGRVGDELKIVNRDSVSHTVGPFLVEAGQTLSSPLKREGVFEGECSLHPSDRVALVVRG